MIPKGPYFDELETASRNQILVCHNDRLRSIVVHAYANAPAFRKKIDSSLNREEMEASFRISFRDICRLNLDKITCVPGGTLSMDGKEIVDDRKNPSG